MLTASVVGAEPTINANGWKVTLPLAGSHGEALEITNPRFAEYLADPASIPENHARFFRVEDSAFVFHCTAGGATTENSDFSRTELREMDGETGKEESEWTLDEGGTMELRFKVGGLAGGADKLIFAQIHGHEPESKPMIKCLWEKGYLRILTKSGEELRNHKEKTRYLPLNEGEWYTCRLTANANEVSVAIDGKIVETFDNRHLKFWPQDNTFYFKAGNYLQEQNQGSAATVWISDISVEHESRGQ